MKGQFSKSGFKLVFYKLKANDFDIFDAYDFEGNELTDDSLEPPKPVKPEEVDAYINKLNVKRNSRPENVKTMPALGAVGKSDISKEYFTKFLEDINSYFVKPVQVIENGVPTTKTGNLNWKDQPVEADFASRAAAHNAYIMGKHQKLQQDKILEKDLYTLIKNTEIIEKDVTNALLSIGPYETSVDDMRNTISFDLSLMDLPKEFRYLQENYVVDFYVDIDSESKDPDTRIYGEYTGPATQEEFDQLKSAVNGDQAEQAVKFIHTRRFIGLISGIDYYLVPGEIPRVTVSCSGISKILERTNLVKDRAIISHFEKYPLDVKQPNVTVFQDNLNDKSVSEIFDYVLSNVFDLFQIKLPDQMVLPQDMQDEKSKATAKKIVDNLFKNVGVDVLITDTRLKDVENITFVPGDRRGRGTGLSFHVRRNVEISNFTSWSLMTLLYFKVREKYTPQINNELGLKIRKATGLTMDKYAFSSIAAIQEANDFVVRVYNLQIKRGHKNFYNKFSSGNETFRTIKDYTYFDIFEDRPGTLTCRPVRLNNLFIGNDDYKDLFIIREEDIIKENYRRNDTGLTSRVDYYPTFPLRDDHIPFCLNYTNSQIMLKYGLNIREGPSVNPNVILWQFTSHFAAVALAYRNGLTRTLSIDVVGNRDYCLGRVYFIPNFIAPNVGFIGRLATISTHYKVGALPIHTLGFNFVRIGKKFSDSQLDVSPTEQINVTKTSSDIQSDYDLRIATFNLAASVSSVTWSAQLGSVFGPLDPETPLTDAQNPFRIVPSNGHIVVDSLTKVDIVVDHTKFDTLSEGSYSISVMFTNVETNASKTRTVVFNYSI